MKKLTYSWIGLAFIATSAQAQQASPSAAPADHAGHSAAADAQASGESATAAYSDAEIESFAKASVKINAINADAALDTAQKQTKMAEAVKEAGLDPAKYNEIGKAAAADSALMAKVQTAMARQSQPSEG